MGCILYGKTRYFVSKTNKPEYANNELLIDFSVVQSVISAFYTEFINKLNAQITYFNDHSHHTSIFVVHLEGVELFFAKDFKLTYKKYSYE
jgi:hypothetical protein